MGAMATNSSTYEGEGGMSARKREIRRRADASAPARRQWLARSAFFHHEDLLYLKFLIPEGARVERALARREEVVSPGEEAHEGDAQ